MKNTGIALAAVLILGLSACSKVTSENYDKIKTGDSFSAVVGVLGEPTNCSDTPVSKSCVWGDDKKSITATFVADKLTLQAKNGL